MPRNIEGEGSFEREPIPELKIGNGDPIKINKIDEKIERTIDGVRQLVNVELSPEEIQKMSQDLLKLPFHMGVNDKRSSQDSHRPTHDAEVTIMPAALGMSKDEAEYHVVFKFQNPEVWITGFHPHSAKNLEISQPMLESAQGWPQEERDKIHVCVIFSPEKPVKLGDKKVTQITLRAQR